MAQGISEVLLDTWPVQMGSSSIESDVDEFLDLWFEDPTRPGETGILAIGLEKIGVKAQELLEVFMPESAALSEEILEFLLVPGKWGWVLRQMASLPQHLLENRPADVVRVDAKGPAQLQDLRDLLFGGASFQRTSYMPFRTGTVEMGRGSCDSQMDKVADLLGENALLGRHAHQPGVDLEHERVKIQQSLQALVPIPMKGLKLDSEQARGGS